jgi:hypothetical protein
MSSYDVCGTAVGWGYVPTMTSVEVPSGNRAVPEWPHVVQFALRSLPGLTPRNWICRLIRIPPESSRVGTE